MAVTTSSSIGHVVDTVIAEARRTQMHRTVMEPLVHTYRVSKGAGDRLEIPKFGTVTAGALVEGTDMTNPQTLTTTKLTITPGEVGAQIVVTDRALRTAREDMSRAAGRVLGDAIAQKLDKDLLGLLDGFSTSLGGAGTNITMGHLRAAVSRLHGAAQAALRGSSPVPGARSGGRHLAHRHLPGSERHLADRAGEPLGDARLRGGRLPGRQSDG